jgi:hypothetical protein
MFTNWEGGPKTRQETLNWLRRAAKMGDPFSTRLLAIYNQLIYNLGGDMMQFWSSLARASDGDGIAGYISGTGQLTGGLGPGSETLEMLDRSFRLGCVEAAVFLGGRYAVNGELVKGYGLLLYAANCGDPLGLCDLMQVVTANGFVVVADDVDDWRRAHLRWARRAAESHDFSSVVWHQQRLARKWMDFPSDLVAAVRCARKYAVSSGDTPQALSLFGETLGTGGWPRRLLFWYGLKERWGSPRVRYSFRLQPIDSMDVLFQRMGANKTQVLMCLQTWRRPKRSGHEGQEPGESAGRD